MIKKWFRKLHRWLGLLMALQILAWMASGLYFSIIPIETIRGEHLVSGPTALPAEALDGLLPAARAWEAVQVSLGTAVKLASMSVVVRGGTPYYRVAGTQATEPFVRLVDARRGEVQAFLDEGKVRAIASASLVVPSRVRSVELVTEATPGSEYRGRSLPLWRVSHVEPESLNLYVDGWTGEVVARRTARWRIFDFLWMLHIMDFEDRDDFNTGLLQVAAALGLLLALTGLVYWAMSTRLFRRRRRRAA
jgi:uncharacterized iron-regulated membrane protein